MIFRPSTTLTLALIALAAMFLKLGFWQLERKAEKRKLFDQFNHAPLMQLDQALLNSEGFAQVDTYGRYDATRHILLDNRVLNGRAGVHALTPFTTQSGKRLLVNRGWLPLPADRRSLPAVATDHELRTISGILKRPVVGGPRIGEADVLVAETWPQLVTYLDLDDVGEALGEPVEPWLLQLDPADDSGFEGRQWQAAVMTPEVHGAYAVQWFALTAASLVIWITLGIRRAQQLAKIRQEH
jgi:cytochrome oxidase assembly protein ShyY1